MTHHNDKDLHQTTDELFEDLTDEEMIELALQAQEEALAKKDEKDEKQTQRQFPKWLFWLMVVTLSISTFASIFQIFSIPAIDFLKTSAILSKEKTIQQFKQAVVVVYSEDSKGTGFAISEDGYILTNHHVIDKNTPIKVVFPDQQRFEATVYEQYPEIDLALLKVEGEQLPHLQIAEKPTFHPTQKVSFIGNPLSFHGIANEGTILGKMQLESWQEEVYMMDAPVYRGNSGSPILNKEGFVIGVIFATYQHESHGEVGLAVPIELFLQETNWRS